MSRDRRSPSALGAIRGPDDFAVAFDVSRETIARLVTFESLLRHWQKAVNLVAPSTLEAIWHRHFADSAQLLALAPAARSWVDLGSGAGFPGLVIAILMAGNGGTTPTSDPSPQGGGEPQSIPRVTLVESNARKCAFMREVVRQTGVSAGVAVDILSTRIESAATQDTLPPPDVVSARALAPLDRLFALAAPLFTSRTVGLFLKGRDVAAELEAAGKMWNFNVDLVPSRTERDGRVVVVHNLEPKRKGITS